VIDLSRAALNLKGVLIKGQVELVAGEEARKINRLNHLKYVTPDALDDPTVATYLSRGDDVTVKVHMDCLISVNDLSFCMTSMYLFSYYYVVFYCQGMRRLRIGFKWRRWNNWRTS
jgi:hypothetical protein